MTTLENTNVNSTLLQNISEFERREQELRELQDQLHQDQDRFLRESQNNPSNYKFTLAIGTSQTGAIRTRVVSDSLNDFTKSSVTRFIVRSGDDGEYAGYRFKIDMCRDKQTFEILVAPPILANGLLCYKKKLYRVTIKDILSRKFKVVEHGTVDTSTGSSSAINLSEPQQEGRRENSWTEDLALANNIVQEQAFALQGIQDPEAFWQVSEDSQP